VKRPFVRNPNGGASTRAKEVRVAMSLPSLGITALKPHDTAEIEVPIG
jgi:hypothetical protein